MMRRLPTPPWSGRARSGCSCSGPCQRTGPASTPHAGEHVERPPQQLPPVHSRRPLLLRLLPGRGGDLSDGQQQLALGRARVLDEPSKGIQPSIIQEIERVIRELAHAATWPSCGSSSTTSSPGAGRPDQYAVMSRGEVVRRGRGAQMEAETCPCSWQHAPAVHVTGQAHPAHAQSMTGTPTPGARVVTPVHGVDSDRAVGPVSP